LFCSFPNQSEKIWLKSNVFNFLHDGNHVSPFKRVLSLQYRLYALVMSNGAWREEIMEKMTETVQQSGGLSEVTLDELVGQIVPHGKACAPASVQNDITNRIKHAVAILEKEPPKRIES
jgi:hypothetical protein